MTVEVSIRQELMADYRKLVDDLARNTRAITREDLQFVLAPLGKSLDDAEADATKLRQRLRAVDDLRTAATKRSEVKAIEERSAALVEQRQSISREFNAKLLEIDRELQQIGDQARVLRRSSTSLHSTAIRDLRRTADPRVHDRIRALNNELQMIDGEADALRRRDQFLNPDVRRLRRPDLEADIRIAEEQLAFCPPDSAKREHFTSRVTFLRGQLRALTEREQETAAVLERRQAVLQQIRDLEQSLYLTDTVQL